MATALLTDLMMQAPYQPATNYWRSVETWEIVRYGLPKGRGLDLGCGDGHLMGIILARIGPRDLIGVDVDSRETVMAGTRHVYRHVIASAGNYLPFADNYFDYVFSNSVLEHIEPIRETLQEVARVLQPKGRFLFTVPGPGFHGCLRGPRRKDRDDYLRGVDARCFHLRYWNEAEWEERLGAVGLTVLHKHHYLTQAEVQRWEFLANYTSGLLYRLGRGRKQPIEIQRRLGVRSTRFRLPRLPAALMARVLRVGVRNGGPQFGCLLVDAQKA